MVCCHPHHQTRIWICGEILHRILILSTMINRVSRRIAYIQPSAVLAHRLILIQILNAQLSQWLVVLREMALHLSLQAIRLFKATRMRGIVLCASGEYTFMLQGSPVHNVMSFSEIFSVSVLPYTIPPIIPLPITSASSK